MQRNYFSSLCISLIKVCSRSQWSGGHATFITVLNFWNKLSNASSLFRIKEPGSREEVTMERCPGLQQEQIFFHLLEQFFSIVDFHVVLFAWPSFFFCFFFVFMIRLAQGWQGNQPMHGTIQTGAIATIIFWSSQSVCVEQEGRLAFIPVFFFWNCACTKLSALVWEDALSESGIKLMHWQYVWNNSRSWLKLWPLLCFWQRYQLSLRRTASDEKESRRSGSCTDPRHLTEEHTKCRQGRLPRSWEKHFPCL